jgi:hypothetical protein
MPLAENGEALVVRGEGPAEGAARSEPASAACRRSPRPRGWASHGRRKKRAARTKQKVHRSPERHRWKQGQTTGDGSHRAAVSDRPSPRPPTPDKRATARAERETGDEAIARRRTKGQLIGKKKNAQASPSLAANDHNQHDRNHPDAKAKAVQTDNRQRLETTP